jgi:hypothetical protein
MAFGISIKIRLSGSFAEKKASLRAIKNFISPLQRVKIFKN